MKIRVWCDSGANAHSKREEIIDLSDMGMTKKEWMALSEEEKESTAKEWALANFDWGFSEIP